MLVSDMSGLWQWCYLTNSCWKESCVALETLRGATRFENSTAITSLPGKILLLCHSKMMDCHCCGVLLYASLGHEWALAMVLPDNFMLEGVALPLLKLSEGRRGLKIDRHNISCQEDL